MPKVHTNTWSATLDHMKSLNMPVAIDLTVTRSDGSVKRYEHIVVEPRSLMALHYDLPAEIIDDIVEDVDKAVDAYKKRAESRKRSAEASSSNARKRAVIEAAKARIAQLEAEVSASEMGELQISP